MDEKNIDSKNSNNLLVSIIPYFNQGDFIDCTLQTILKQHYPHKEIIIIDGRSTDIILKNLKQYPNDVQWISEKNEGYADAVNKGFKLANGSIIGIQSSDDYYNQKSRIIDIWDVLEYFMIPKQDAIFVRKKAIEAVGGLQNEVEYYVDVGLCTCILALRSGLKVERFWSFPEEKQNLKRLRDEYN